MIVLPYFLVLNIAKHFVSWKIVRDSVKLGWDLPFVDALGHRDSVKIKPKSNIETANKIFSGDQW